MDPAPEAFIDHSFSLEVFVDPVVTSDGHTYSRAAIERWLRTHDTSPATGARLADKRLSPNHALRQAIEEWHQRRPMAIEPSRLTVSDRLLGEGSFGRVMAGELQDGPRTLQVAVKTLPALSGAWWAGNGGFTSL